jgi:hypothetical protein
MTQLERILKLQLTLKEDIIKMTSTEIIHRLKKLKLPYTDNFEDNLSRLLSIHANHDLLILHYATDMPKIERRLLHNGSH